MVLDPSSSPSSACQRVTKLVTIPQHLGQHKIERTLRVLCDLILADEAHATVDGSIVVDSLLEMNRLSTS